MPSCVVRHGGRPGRPPTCGTTSSHESPELKSREPGADAASEAGPARGLPTHQQARAARALARLPAPRETTKLHRREETPNRQS